MWRGVVVACSLLLAAASGAANAATLDYLIVSTNNQTQTYDSAVLERRPRFSD
jgi:hypothetical protein